MPLDSLVDLSGLNGTELYAVYLAIARADHRWRVDTLHGDPARPMSEFRPLTMEQFDARLAAAGTMAGGETMLRERLSRQAAAYGVDITLELSRVRSAA